MEKVRTNRIYLRHHFFGEPIALFQHFFSGAKISGPWISPGRVAQSIHRVGGR